MDSTINTLSYKDLELIVYDFDGVMTNNRVIVFQDGTEGVIVNRADGLGVDRLRKLRIPQLILSTETNAVVKARASKLRLELIDSCNDKKNFLIDFCDKNNFNLNNVLYIGNDLNDLGAMQIVGFSVAPSDAHFKILKVAKLVTNAKGGEGVINELADYLIDGTIEEHNIIVN